MVSELWTRVAAWETSSHWHGHRRAHPEARRVLGAVVRRSWAPLLVAAVLVPAVAATVLFVSLHGSSGLLTWPLLSVYVCLTFYVAGRNVALLSAWASHFVGQAGQAWSASELWRARRWGLRLMRNARLGSAGDLSHVAVGPGGVWVVESKWRPDRRGDDAGITTAVRKVQAGVDDVRSLLGHELDGTPVQPLVVVWVLDDSFEATCDGVPVISGDRLRHWLHEHVGGSVLTPAQVDLAWDRLLQQAQLQDSRAARTPTAA